MKKCTRPIDYDKYFKPAGVFFDLLETNEISIEEFEVLRLCDLEGNNQIEAAYLMRVSRTTIQRLLKSARLKIIDAILNTKAIKVNSKTEYF